MMLLVNRNCDQSLQNSKVVSNLVITLLITRWAAAGHRGIK